jgi:hypothetical protein
MPFGKYNLRSPGVNKSLQKAASRAKRLNGKVVIVQKADPEKLDLYRKKQREKRKNGGNLQ